MENRTADIIQETRKLHIKKKSGVPETQTTSSNVGINKQFQQLRVQTQPQTETDIAIQLKASRDVRFQLCIIGLHSNPSCIGGNFHPYTYKWVKSISQKGSVSTLSPQTVHCDSVV